jgi:L-threonylcarbamoyladenylate synthase
VSREVRRAAEILKRGGLVAFPTETVYGLGADAANEKAVARLYAVKGRPADHPVIVHFASAAQAFAWAREVPEAARRLAARFWPGPLTLILKRSQLAQDFVTGGQDTVGLRVPSHPIAHEMLSIFGSGVAAPSANRFGLVSPTTAAHVREDLGDEVDLVLEGGPSEVGIESTIVDLSGPGAVLLRPGGVTKQQLEQVVPFRESDQASPRHSGGLERHYAPRTPARLVPTYALDKEISSTANRIAVLAFSRPDERVDYWLRMPRDPAAYAQRLYAALRELDAA